jgi:hypothetical protein
MTMTDDVKMDLAAQRRDWVEPEVSELPVEDTAGFPARGSDGGRFFDCTRS